MAWLTGLANVLMLAVLLRLPSTSSLHIFRGLAYPCPLCTCATSESCASRERELEAAVYIYSFCLWFSSCEDHFILQTSQRSKEPYTVM